MRSLIFAGHLVVAGVAQSAAAHACSENPQTMVAVLTLETEKLTFEFAVNEEGARALAGNLEQFLGMVESRGGRAN